MREACEVLKLHPLGEYPLACVGESHYQNALEQICDASSADGNQVSAVLCLEDTNPYDSEAVRVDVHGATVGDLSREDARTYRNLLNAVGCSDSLECRGVIRGGWNRGATNHGFYGIWLD